MMEVNFWDYATNEYCLDSFICYLLRFEKAKKAFFKLCGIEENEKIQDKGIRQQNKNVDVLIETSNSFLIIEDKVDSSEHDNQIKKYIEAVEKENKEKEIHVCYVKLGFLSEQEKRDISEEVKKVEIKDEDKIIKTLYFSEEKKNLCFINLSDLLKISDCIKENEIIKQWIEKHEKLLNEQSKNFKEMKKYIDNDDYETLYDVVFKDKGKYLYLYLDWLTNEIRQKSPYKNTQWYTAGFGTAHIELKCTERMKLTDDCWESHSLFIMFRSDPELVLKQHFYKREEGNNRINIKDYNKTAKDKLEDSRKVIFGLIDKWELKNKSWKKIDTGKDKLMLCQKLLKKSDNLVNIVKTEEYMEELFKALK